jgi:hypothetical protein
VRALRRAAPAWLDGVSIGALLIMGTTLVLVALRLVSRAAGAEQPALRILASLMMLPTAVTLWVGLWLLTRPDPGGNNTPAAERWRKLVRVAVVAQPVMALLTIAELLWDAAVPLLFRALYIAYIPLTVTGWWAHLSYVRALCLRAAAHRLAWQARWVAVVVPVTAGGLYAVLWFGRQLSWASLVLLALVLALMIVAVLYWALLVTFGRRLRHEARLARQAVGGAPAPGGGA